MTANKEFQVHFLAGMPRAGTTFLYHNLNKHPDIFIPFRRKTNYFAIHYKKSTKWFFDHFKGKKEHQIGLDTDTLSFIFDESYQRFLQFSTDEKLILVVRNPAAWALSLYKQIDTFAFDLPPFQQYLENGYTLVEDGERIYFQFGPGDVKRKIESYKEDFRGRLLLLDFELVAENPLRLLKEIESFLRIRSYFEEGNYILQKINSSDRQSNKYLAALLRKKWLIKLLQKLMPRKLVIALRTRYDASGVKHLNAPPKESAKSESLEIAEQHYEKDIAYVKALFERDRSIHC